MKFNFKSATGCIWHHSKILFNGFVRMVSGTATAGLFALAGYGLVMIPSEGGYIAVCDFIVAIATICIAVTCMYSLGCTKKRKCRFSSKG